jgi:hypothetical protein
MKAIINLRRKQLRISADIDPSQHSRGRNTTVFIPDEKDVAMFYRQQSFTLPRTDSVRSPLTKMESLRSGMSRTSSLRGAESFSLEHDEGKSKNIPNDNQAEPSQLKDDTDNSCS